MYQRRPEGVHSAPSPPRESSPSRDSPPPRPTYSRIGALWNDDFASQSNLEKPVNEIHVASKEQSRNPITSTPTDSGPSDSTGHRPVIYNHHHHSSRNLGPPPPSSIYQSASQQQAPYNNSNVSGGERMDNAIYLRVPPLTGQSAYPQHPNTLPPLSPISHRLYPSAPSFPPPLTRPQRPNTVSPLSHISQFGKVGRGKQVSWGSYSDIWCGTLLIGKKTVAIKTLRVKQSSSRMSKTSPEERLQKRFFREVLLWAKLRHPNIVPLLSYAMLSNGVPSLVSPRYPNCNLKEYLELNPKAGRHSLVNDVAKALSYLHSISVVHGDIKAENVLIDAEGVASMCDFGLSQFLDKAVRITTTQANTGGTDRYLCPELLEEDKKTTMSDMWALACLIMLILTDEIPHARVTSRAMVFNAILRGTHPYTKPDKPIKESLWNSVVKCWSISPVDRPSASDMESLILLEILVKNNSSSQTEVVIAQPSASSLSSDASPSSSSDPPGISGIKTTDFPPPAVLNDPITSEGLGMDDILPKLSTKVPVDTILRRRTGPTIVPGWAVPPRVLLVDDDPVSRKLFSKFLQVCGCTIGVAVDGIGAVNKVNLEKYDLVLMDIVMPKLDGASATSLIRQFDHMTPIISMTSNSRPNEVLTYFSSGMNDILPKPFTKENLFTMLEKHLGHLKQQMSKPSIDTSDPSSSKQSLNEDGVVIGTNAMRNTLKRGLDKVDDDGTTSKTGIFEVLE